MQHTLPSAAAEGSRVTVSSTLQRFIGNVAARLRPQPDRSMINLKFTDSLERELIAHASRDAWRGW